MKLGQLLLQGLQFILLALPGLTRLDQGLLQFGLVCLLVGNGGLLLGHRLSGVLRKGFVRSLSTVLRPHGFCFHGFGVFHQLLQHRHDSEALAIGLVILESARCLWCLLTTLQKGALVVELAQNRQSLLQQALCLTLLSNDLLKFGVLLLAVLPGHLQLLLHVCDLTFQSFDVTLGLRNVNGLLLCQKGRLGTGLLLSLQLILAELIHAEILLLHLVGLFLLQGKDHVIHGLLDVGEFVDLHLHGQAQDTRILGL
mmetsp:Transcript_7231/g.8989  ORF Transcript_7231/g.8989 Transcript_7231/m.8989 type:complete len:255 (+) Transcript_7231:176-940(+)